MHAGADFDAVAAMGPMVPLKLFHSNDSTYRPHPFRLQLAPQTRMKSIEQAMASPVSPQITRSLPPYEALQAVKSE